MLRQTICAAWSVPKKQADYILIFTNYKKPCYAQANIYYQGIFC